MYTIYLDFFSETSLNVDLNSQLNPDHPFLKAFDIAIELVAQRLCSPWLYLDSVYKLLPYHNKFLTNRKVMYDFIDKVSIRIFILKG